MNIIPQATSVEERLLSSVSLVPNNKQVIISMIGSLQTDISSHEFRGRSTNISINDDGLRAAPSEEEFTVITTTTWTRVARPSHNGEEIYLRARKSKKISNMNFALNMSQKVEVYLYLKDMMEEKLPAEVTDFICENERE